MQARRGVYHAFLSEVNAIEAQIAKLQDLMFYSLLDEGTGGAGGWRGSVRRGKVKNEFCVERGALG
ncbi:hypothetical protein [Streptomyces acidicola]|uniref:hypothetical protein n=1 Tax=Streptomyces acidicola TaxID=2596892 RepID=UPI0034330C91